MLYELILINEIEQRAKIIFLSVERYIRWTLILHDGIDSKDRLS